MRHKIRYVAEDLVFAALVTVAVAAFAFLVLVGTCWGERSVTIGGSNELGERR